MPADVDAVLTPAAEGHTIDMPSLRGPQLEVGLPAGHDKAAPGDVVIVGRARPASIIARPFLWLNVPCNNRGAGDFAVKDHRLLGCSRTRNENGLRIYARLHEHSIARMNRCQGGF